MKKLIALLLIGCAISAIAAPQPQPVNIQVRMTAGQANGFARKYSVDKSAFDAMKAAHNANTNNTAITTNFPAFNPWLDDWMGGMVAAQGDHLNRQRLVALDAAVPPMPSDVDVETQADLTVIRGMARTNAAYRAALRAVPRP